MKAVSAVYHLAARGIQAPALIDHAVHRHHKPRAIGSVIAVHEHGALFLALANGAQDVRDLRGFYLPALKRLVREPKLIPERPFVAASAKMAQIYDAFDAQARAASLRRFRQAERCETAARPRGRNFLLRR